MHVSHSILDRSRDAELMGMSRGPMAQFEVFIELRIGGNVRTGLKIGGKEIWDVIRRI